MKKLLKVFKQTVHHIPDKFKSIVKPGDVILSRTDGIYGQVMTKLKGFKYTHAMLVLGKDRFDNITVLESDIAHDVRPVLLCNKPGKKWLLQLEKPLDIGEQDKLFQYFNTIKDRKYEDISDITKLGFNVSLKEDLNDLFCSELVAGFFEMIGRVKYINCSAVLPDTLADDECFRNIFKAPVLLK